MNNFGVPPPYPTRPNDPYSQGGVLPIEAPRKPNSCWTGWGALGIAGGLILILLGVAMIPIEVSRILQGSLNRGVKGSFFLYPNYNYQANSGSAQIAAFIPDLNTLALKGIEPYNAVVPTGLKTNGANYPIQDKYLWPWSHAALLFCLVTIAAGILGVMSGCRKTYSTIYAFFVLSLLSFFLSIFLVAYYAVHVYWQLNQNNNLRNAVWASNIDYALGATMLAISCATLVASLAATCCACMGAGVCKGPKAELLRIPSKQKAPAQPKPAKVNKKQQQQLATGQNYQPQPYYAGQPQPRF